MGLQSSEAPQAADSDYRDFIPQQDMNDPNLNDTGDTYTVFAAAKFGRPHPGDCRCFAMCDGSVHVVSYNIDPETHYMLANRKDGMDVSIP